jgi:hypothetical protein
MREANTLRCTILSGERASSCNAPVGRRSYVRDCAMVRIRLTIGQCLRIGIACQIVVAAGCQRSPVKVAEPETEPFEVRFARVQKNKSELQAKNRSLAAMKAEYDHKLATSSFTIGNFKNHGRYQSNNPDDDNERLRMENAISQLEGQIASIEASIDREVGWPYFRVSRLESRIRDLAKLDRRKNLNAESMERERRQELKDLLERVGPCPPDLAKTWGL